MKVMSRPISLLLCVCCAAVATLFSAAGASAGDEYSGEYLLPSGKYVSVFKEGVIAEMARLKVINWESWRAGGLESDGADRFVVPPSSQDAGDGMRITFARGGGGEVSGLLLEAGHDSPVKADRKVTFVEKPVTFTNGDVLLSGALKLPVGQGPFPAVVLVHGSGPGGREQVESTARFFCHLGMAALSYDKRGCGASTGDWKTVDLEALAGDALAGAAMLRSRADIDEKRVGLWGISQGGWIVPLAASRSDDIAFAINHSGPGTSLRRQDTYMMSNVLKMQGLPDSDIDLAIAALNTLYDYGRGKAQASALDAAIGKLKGRPGLEDYATLSSRELVPDSLYAHQAIGDPAWFFHLDPDRDAIEPYRRLRCPLLVVYGRLDYTVPVDESVKAISAALEERTHPDYLVKALERTGHGMLVMDPEAPSQPVKPPTLAHEYFELLEGWLSERGLTGRAG
jgi:pimeloyl-ACP methyl ester carboxylesterase